MTDSEIYMTWLKTAPELDVPLRLCLHLKVYGDEVHARLCKILDRFGVVTS